MATPLLLDEIVKEFVDLISGLLLLELFLKFMSLFEIKEELLLLFSNADCFNSVLLLYFSENGKLFINCFCPNRLINYRPKLDTLFHIHLCSCQDAIQCLLLPSLSSSVCTVAHPTVNFTGSDETLHLLFP